jgi:hypothetical protein
VWRELYVSVEKMWGTEMPFGVLLELGAQG